jgi:hypothetical protein
MIDLVEGVSPFTPPRVRTRITMKQKEITNNIQKFLTNSNKKQAKPLSTKKYPSTCKKQVSKKVAHHFSSTIDKYKHP